MILDFGYFIHLPISFHLKFEALVPRVGIGELAPSFKLFPRDLLEQAKEYDTYRTQLLSLILSFIIIINSWLNHYTVATIAN